MMRPNRALPGRLAVLLVLWGAAGCAPSRSIAPAPPPELDRREAIRADRQFSLKSIPLNASPQRAASFRIAAEGLQALAARRYQEAEDRLERALTLDPRNPFCYLHLAEIRFRAGDPEQALLLLHQAEVHFQGHPYWLSEVFTRKGLYLEALRSPAEARRSYRKALEHNPWNEAPRKRLEKTDPSQG